jgi:carbonic anhydrase/acetyltransferase-like protein (isoleucine patch superfamily)
MTVFALKGVRPTIGNGTFIAPNASVIGDVVLGDECSVWFGAVVRGDVYPIRIGARTNVQDNSVVHVTGGLAKTTIGEDVTIGHSSVIHGCTIGNRCLIGMGSIILDGAVIEDDCFVGAGSLVSPRTRIPTRSLVMGRPGRVVRTLSPGDLEQIREAGALYVGYARDFVAGLVAF